MIGQFYNDDSRRPIGSVVTAHKKCTRSSRRGILPAVSARCDRAVVSVSEPGSTVATLRINFRGLKKEFTTENLNRPGTRTT